VSLSITRKAVITCVSAHVTAVRRSTPFPLSPHVFTVSHVPRQPPSWTRYLLLPPDK